MAKRKNKNVDPERIEAMDKEIRAWAQLTRKKLLFRLASLNLQERVGLLNELFSLRNSLGYRVDKHNGNIEKVAFTFPRHGIFLEHGVGKGRPVRSPKAQASKKPWLSVVLPDAIEELAEILAEEYADITAEKIRFLIPGVVDTTIKR
jgi:hypothetical protein